MNYRKRYRISRNFLFNTYAFFFMIIVNLGLIGLWNIIGLQNKELRFIIGVILLVVFIRFFVKNMKRTFLTIHRPPTLNIKRFFFRRWGRWIRKTEEYTAQHKQTIHKISSKIREGKKLTKKEFVIYRNHNRLFTKTSIFYVIEGVTHRYLFNSKKREILKIMKILEMNTNWKKHPIIKRR